MDPDAESRAVPEPVADRSRIVMQIDPYVPHAGRRQPADVCLEPRRVVDAQHRLWDTFGKAAEACALPRRQDKGFADRHCSCMRTSSNRLRKLPVKGL